MMVLWRNSHCSGCWHCWRDLCPISPGAIRAKDDKTLSDQRAYACLCCAGAAVLLAFVL
ncbi:hypothetical protein [Fournierella sp.]|uniref:hypothetical protein n=1 Tax=Allofournierella sp. TaxID=1940256 RepID=UPI003078E35B